MRVFTILSIILLLLIQNAVAFAGVSKLVYADVTSVWPSEDNLVAAVIISEEAMEFPPEKVTAIFPQGEIDLPLNLEESYPEDGFYVYLAETTDFSNIQAATAELDFDFDGIFFVAEAPGTWDCAFKLWRYNTYRSLKPDTFWFTIPGCHD